MPLIGMFTEEAIQKQIDACAARVGPSGFALVAHLDSDGDASLSIVKRFGDHVSVESTAKLDLSNGFKFDRDHLKAQVEVIGSW